MMMIRRGRVNSMMSSMTLKYMKCHNALAFQIKSI